MTCPECVVKDGEIARLKQALAHANKSALAKPPIKTARELAALKKDTKDAPAPCGQFCRAIHEHVR